MSLTHPAIIEIWGRTEQGMTKPYRCSTDDECSYFVKSAGAGWRSLVCEWLAGRLATAFGLPLPPIAQVRVDDFLAEIFRAQGDHDLAAGLAFGSQQVRHVRDFEPALVTKCKPAFRRDLVAFDWWVHNADRTLGELSGNPNLLWVPGEERPVVIDHNLAFDPGFDPQLFADTHVFAEDLRAILGDWVLRADYEQRFCALLPVLNAAWSELPHNWTHDEDNHPRMALSSFEATISRAQQEDFWCIRP
jgi:hypothetical protein